MSREIVKEFTRGRCAGDSAAAIYEGVKAVVRWHCMGEFTRKNLRGTGGGAHGRARTGRLD